MEKIFTAIQTAIAEKYKFVKNNVEEDYGQLEMLYQDGEENDTYPVTFPLVLIDFKKVDWTSLGATGTPVQTGNAIIDIKLVMDCYDDTHYTSGTAEKAVERMQHVHELHSLLQGMMIERYGIMNRTESTFETLRKGIKMYTMRYILKVEEKNG